MTLEHLYRFHNFLVIPTCIPVLNSGGSRIPCRRGHQHTILSTFPKKLHEIEKILGRGGMGMGEGAPDQPLLYSLEFTKLALFELRKFFDFLRTYIWFCIFSVIAQFDSSWLVKKNAKFNTVADPGFPREGAAST